MIACGCQFNLVAMDLGGEQLRVIRDLQLGKIDWLLVAAPLLLPAIALALGILAGQFSDPSSWYWPAVVLILGILLGLLYRSKTRLGLVLACTCAFAALGMVRSHHARLIGPNDIRRYLADQPRLVRLEGLVWSRPRQQGHDWSFSQLYPWLPTYSLLLASSSIHTASGPRPITGLVRLETRTQSDGQVQPGSDPDGLGAFRPGDRIEVLGWLSRPRAATNPGQFDMADHLERRHVRAILVARSSLSIRPLDRPWFGWHLRLVGYLQDRAAEALRCGWSEGTCGHALVNALLLGSRSYIDSRTYQAFRQTGLVHYLSLSGLHFGIIMGTVWLIGHLLGLLHPTRAWACILVAGMYLLVIPPTAPTLRAAVITLVYCGSIVLRRQAQPFNTLSLAAIILLLYRPENLFDPSWQLSFACLVGIFLVAVPLHRWMDGLMMKYASSRLWWVLLYRLARSIYGLLAVGLGASLASGGIILYHFYRLNLLSVIWTAMVFPLVWLVMVLGVTKLLVCLVLPDAGHILAGATEVPAHALTWLVGYLSDLNICILRTGSVGLGTVMLYYLALASVVLRPLARPVLRVALGAILAFAFLTALSYGHYLRSRCKDLIITCLDVGHGQAVIVRAPGDKTVLIDGGSLFIPDAGSRVIAPALESLAIDRLDAILISHTDMDHVNGLPEVMAAVRTQAVYAVLDDGPASKIITGACHDEGVPIRPWHCLQSAWPGGMEIQVLWPPADVNDPALSDNDRSAVILLSFAGRSVLFCSDIEQYAQARLISRYQGLQADVVLVPHHGSAKTLHPDLLDRLRPGWLLCSCTANQALQVRSNPCLSGKELYCTGDYGAITVKIRPSGSIHLQTFLPNTSMPR